MTAVEPRGPSIPGLEAVGLLRAQVQETHRLLDDGLTDWLRALAPAVPVTGSRVVALYVHAATVEDVTIHSLLRRIAPVYQRDWAGRGPAHYSTSEILPLRAYAHQVFAATDTFLVGLTPEAASRRVDLSRLGQGRPTVAFIVSKFIVLQLAQIYGELTSATLREPPEQARLHAVRAASERYISRLTS